MPNNKKFGKDRKCIVSNTLLAMVEHTNKQNYLLGYKFGIPKWFANAAWKYVEAEDYQKHSRTILPKEDMFDHPLFDHPKFKNGTFVLEPYEAESVQIIGLAKFCEFAGFEMKIKGFSQHNPGRTFSIFIYDRSIGNK